jgi:hypothetical protein
MHRCEVRIEQIPEGAEYSLTVGWYWKGMDLSDEEKLLPTCGAPANKKLGFMWICDLHYRRHAGSEDGEDDDVTAIVEGGTDADWEEEDAEQAASTDEE